MPLPDPLKRFRQQAEVLIPSVKEIIFSGSTYQVQFFAPDEIWVFLQFSEEEGLDDGFCDCGEEEWCSHIAAACLAISDEEGVLLHNSFASSFWHVLLFHLFDRVEPELVDPSNGVWRLGVVTLTTIDPEVSGFLKERPEETEETSIKFSKLSFEELEQWRAGNPSRELEYELSAWSDLAKYLFLKQKSGVDYRIEVDTTNSLPKELQISFPECKLIVPIDVSGWQAVVAALGTVAFPIPLHHNDILGIAALDYDEATGVVTVTKQKQSRPEEGGVSVGSWVFFSEKGFFPKESGEVALPDTLEGNALSEALSENPQLFRRFLTPLCVHRRPVKISYSGSVRDNGTVIFTAYLRDPGDLDESGVRDFGEWLFLPGDGFYRVLEREFPGLTMTLHPSDVDAFVTRNQTWLMGIPGFGVHTSSVESRLEYLVDEKGNLSFLSRLGDLGFGMRDYGRWVYVSKQGFHPKADVSVSLPVQPGTALAPAFVPVFIKMNKEELSLIPGFFHQRSPVVGAVLDVSLDKKKQIIVTPHFQFRPGYGVENVRFYDEYTYSAGKGFSELLPLAKLPERFRSPTVITASGVPTFLDYEIDLIKEFISHLDPQLRRPEGIELVVNSLEEEDNSRYRLNLHYRTTVGSVSIASLIEGLRSRKRFLFTDAGLIDLRDARYRWLRDLPKENFKEQELSLSTLQLLRLDAIDPLVTEGSLVEEKLSNILSTEIPEELDLTGLEGRLRSYQLTGVRWLAFLYQHGLSGLLCDDMGLGKTHEAMALMALVRNINRSARFLVVCPTSVIYSWEEKLKKYMPDLSVHTYHGSTRSLEKTDVLLTSFGIWRNEVERLKKIHFDLAIFDEVQVAKNRSSRTHKALKQVRSSMMLGLTGTPIENALWELKALFDLVLPGYLAADSDFRDQFVHPIERQSSEKAREKLIRLIRPFILRRRKVDVLQDLPQKTEEVAHCELSDDQRALYSQAVAEMRGDLLPQLVDSQAPLPYVHVFALLTRLKQICDHPAVPLQDIENYHLHKSGKWELFCELLSEALNSGQKVVVFSQYLSMLDIMELYLKELDVPYASIRGSTRDRGAQLRLFNNDPDCMVFLGSLQAIGLGVDLTAASVVIHYDRWWNAAKEDQATDRVHRIGQLRGVQVFKLVTLNTFEERIDELIRRKGKLMNEIIAVDDQTLIKTLTREELLELIGE